LIPQLISFEKFKCRFWTQQLQIQQIKIILYDFKYILIVFNYNIDLKNGNI